MTTDARTSGLSVYLGLGTNLGDRRANLREAAARVEAMGIEITRASSLYETEPVGYRDQPWFLNQVIAARLEHDHCMAPGTDAIARMKTAPEADSVSRAASRAETLLGSLLGIEEVMGRERTIAVGTRLIDIDLLLYGDEVIARPTVVVPHPRLHLRRFVLEPLCEIAPGLTHPAFGKSFCELLAALNDSSTVRRLG